MSLTGLVLGLVAALYVSYRTGLSLPLILGGVVALWLLSKLKAPAPGGGGGGGAVSAIVGGVRDGIAWLFGAGRWMLVFLVVFVGEMFIAGWAFGVGPYAHTRTPVIMLVCCGLLAAAVAALTASGNWRAATYLFAGTLAVALIFTYLPGETEMVGSAAKGVDTTLVKNGGVKKTIWAAIPKDRLIPRAWGAAREILFGAPAPAEPEKKSAAEATPAAETGALVLRHECNVPCSTVIDYRAQIWGDGEDFLVRFPGVADPVLFSRGKYTAPDGVQFGEVSFELADPAQPVTVRVYEMK